MAQRGVTNFHIELNGIQFEIYLFSDMKFDVFQRTYKDSKRTKYEQNVANFDV